MGGARLCLRGGTRGQRVGQRGQFRRQCNTVIGAAILSRLPPPSHPLPGGLLELTRGSRGAL